MEKKMTKVENLNAIQAILNENGHDEFNEFITHEVELLSRKRTSSKPTKRQIENEGVKVRIAEILSSADEGLQASQISNEFDGEVNVPRVSALLKQMKDAGIVNREVVKGKSYYSLA